MATGMKDDDMMKQVQHFWTMLDELAESDGDAYKKFMEKNLQKGREELATAKPWLCVKTYILKPCKETLYINICSWSRITKPQTNTEAIKVTGGPVQNEKDDTGPFKVVRVAFNPEVLEECAKTTEDQDMLIRNAIDYLKDQKKLHISHHFQICQDVKFRGDPRNLRDFFADSHPEPKQQQDHQQENLSKLTPDSLLSQLRVSDNHSEAANDSPELTLKTNGVTSKDTKISLIEELSSVEVQLTCPEFEVSLKEADANRLQRIVVRIDLPGVDSVADCELDITEDELSLLVSEKYQLHLPLPETILEEKSTAKFNSSKSTLTVSMPTKSLKS